MRRLIQQVSARQVTYEQIGQLTALINAPNRTQTAPLPGGVVAQVWEDQIVLRVLQGQAQPPAP